MLEKKKKRIIVEARYKALVSIFDRRGAILEALGDKFGTRLQHWKVDTASVAFMDSQDKENLKIQVSHQRASFVFEDYPDENQAVKDAIDTFTIIRNIASRDLTTTGRIGVRFIDVFSHESINSFDKAKAIVNAGFFKDSFPLSVPVTDVRATLNYERGSLNVGPIRSDEPWISEMFATPDANVPEYGIGLDVDSYIESTNWSSDSDVARSIRGVAAMTGSIQGEVVKYLSEFARGKTSKI